MGAVEMTSEDNGRGVSNDICSQGHQANRARLSVALSQFTVPYLTRVYHAFDGDVVTAIVLGEIAHRNVEVWLSDLAHAEDPLRDETQSEALMSPCNALSIAEVCRLPRETVRRKVTTLIKHGYIYRGDGGHLYLSSTVGDDFKDMTAELVEHLLETAQHLEALLAAKNTTSADTHC